MESWQMKRPAVCWDQAMQVPPLLGESIAAGDFVLAEWMLHRHFSDDEAWYVLEGSLGFVRGDDRLEAPAGSIRSCSRNPQDFPQVWLAKSGVFAASALLHGHVCRGTFFWHRARSASRSKPLPRAVGGSRRFTGKVDESATGSVNFWSDTFVVGSREGYFGMRSQKFSQIAGRTVEGLLNLVSGPGSFPLAPSTERE
jgi:hypothetical protein